MTVLSVSRPARRDDHERLRRRVRLRHLRRREPALLTPFKLPSCSTSCIGLVVVFIQDYLDNLGTISRILTACSRSCSGRCSSLGIDVRIYRSRYDSPPTWPASESARSPAARADGTRDSQRLRKQGLIPGILYGRGKTALDLVPERELRRALTGGGGMHAILDVVLDGAEDDAPVDPQGLPAGSAQGQLDARRPAGGSPRPADHGDRAVAARRRRGLARRARGRRALADRARGERRGAADGGARAPRARRQRDGDGRHAAPRRPRRAPRASRSSTIPRRRCSRR